MEWNLSSLIAVILCLAIGGLAGAFVFPTQEIVLEEVEVPGPVKYIDVPGQTIYINNSEELEELQWQLDAADDELRSLKERYEQLAEKEYSQAELGRELAAISRAKRELLDNEHLLLVGDFKLSEMRIEKFYNEEVSLEDVERWVDGKRVDYELAQVNFEVKVLYEDDDRKREERFDVQVSWDLDEDGDEDAELDVERQ